MHLGRSQLIVNVDAISTFFDLGVINRRSLAEFSTHSDGRWRKLVARQSTSLGKV